MKKRILTIILAMISCVVLLSACGEPKEPETGEEVVEQAKSAWQKIKDDAADEKTERHKMVEKNKVDMKENVILSTPAGDVAVSAYSVINTIKSDEEQDVIYLFLKFTNKSGVDYMFPGGGDLGIPASFSAYQNGIKLSEFYDIDTDFITKQIQDGASIEGYKAYTLHDTETDVEIRYTVPGSEDTVYVLKIK